MTQMNAPHQKTSTLQQAGIESGWFEAPGIGIRELRDVRLLRLHSLLEPETLQKALNGCNIQLPVQSNESMGQDPLVVCLRPGEWLLITEKHESGDLLRRLEKILEPDPESQNESQTALLNYSDGYAFFRMSGRAAPWLLSKISSLDFPSTAGTGQHAVRTRMGQIAVLVSYHPVSSETSSEFVFDLIFDRSVAAYLWQLLLTSVPHAQELAAEFGQKRQ